MEKNKRKSWTKKEIELLTINYPTMFNYELVKILNRTEQSIYLKASKLGLKKTTEHKSKCISKRNKMVGRNLTDDYLSDIAKKYKTRAEFQKNDSSAYSSARKKGILNEICGHMISKSFSIPQLILKDIIIKLYQSNNVLYNDRKTLKPYEIDVYLPDFNLGFEYNGKGWHVDNIRDNLKQKLSNEKSITLVVINENTRNYEEDIKNQLILNINKLKIDITPTDINNVIIDNIYSKIYDIDDLKKIAKSYTSFKEFYNNEQTVYTKLRKLNLIDEVTSHMCCRRKKREISEVIDKISNYEYLIDLIRNDKGTYLYIKKNKLDFLLRNLKKLR
jgi:hypothetical protein